MKRLVITIQMVALVAMFPVYLIVELSQEKVKSPVENQASANMERQEEIDIAPLINPDDEGVSFLIHN